MKWYSMVSFKLLVLCLRLLSIKGRIELELWMSQEEVNEFQPLTLIFDLVMLYPIHMIEWISNGQTEFIMDYRCSTEMDSTKDYNISCLKYRQYNLTINNVTRRNHGDIWYCRERYFPEDQSNDVVIQVKDHELNNEFVSQKHVDSASDFTKTTTNNNINSIKLQRESSSETTRYSHNTESENDIPISNISLFTEKKIITVSENESALVQCVCHGGIPVGQITWFYDKGTPDDVSDDVILTEMNNETITQLDNTVTTQSYLALKAVTALIETSLYCKATNDNVNWLFSNGANIAVLLLPSSVEVTHPHTQFVTAYEEKSVHFECVTSPGYPASVIAWYKLTNGSEVIVSANGSSTTEMKDRTIVTRSWLSLTFSMSDDWTFVYCTASSSAGTLTSRNRAAVHVHKVTENFKMDNSHNDSTLAKAAIVLSSITGTALVFFIVGCFIFMKLRSSKGNPRESTHDSGHVNQANDQGKDKTSSRANVKASVENISYSTLQLYENTTLREPYEPMQMAGDS